MIQESTYQETYPRLFALAYRMTGSVADAEDAIHEAWIRLLNQPMDKIDAPAHWLYRAVSNLAIDTLRASKRTATGYHGPWLPEPIATDQYFRDPEIAAIVREDLSMALMMMLEHLTPMQRAVWVLRTSLELPFAVIGEMIGQTETNCRQLFRRAQHRLDHSAEHGLTDAPADVVSSFIAAVQSGDAANVARLLLDDAVWIGDGGGVKPATARPVVGGDNVSRGLAGVFRKTADRFWLEPAWINQAAGMLVCTAAGVELAYTFLVKDGRISHVLAVRNPYKLAGMSARDSARTLSGPGE